MTKHKHKPLITTAARLRMHTPTTRRYRPSRIPFSSPPLRSNRETGCTQQISIVKQDKNARVDKTRLIGADPRGMVVLSHSLT